MIELLHGQCIYLYKAMIDGSLIGYYDNNEDAVTALRSAGNNSSPVPVKAIKDTIDGQAPSPYKEKTNYWLVEKIELSDKDTLKRKALAKLTQEEKRILGLLEK